jgi:hypothetical protein
MYNKYKYLLTLNLLLLQSFIRIVNRFINQCTNVLSFIITTYEKEEKHDCVCNRNVSVNHRISARVVKEKLNRMKENQNKLNNLNYSQVLFQPHIFLYVRTNGCEHVVSVPVEKKYNQVNSNSLEL